MNVGGVSSYFNSTVSFDNQSLVISSGTVDSDGDNDGSTAANTTARTVEG